MKKEILIISLSIFLGLLCLATSSRADNNFALILSGKILLAVKSHGEAWYVNPTDLKRYYLGRPNDAFNIMKNLSLGITNANLTKIPVGVIPNNNTDSDNDGLEDAMEISLGTNPQVSDSDSDGYNDKTEILNSHNPTGAGKLNINNAFAKKYSGKIFLQTESKGEAWYINPGDYKRYFLGRPTDVLNVIKKLGLGITNEDLNKIDGTTNTADQPILSSDQQTDEIKEVINAAADALRINNADKFKSYFTSEVKPLTEYILNIFDNDQRLSLGNILSGSKLSSSTETEKIYTNEIYFSLGDYKVPIKFIVKKQPNGTWKIANL